MTIVWYFYKRGGSNVFNFSATANTHDVGNFVCGLYRHIQDEVVYGDKRKHPVDCRAGRSSSEGSNYVLLMYS